MIFETTIEVNDFEFCLSIEYSITGTHSRPTMTDPEEFPELIIESIYFLEFEYDLNDKQFSDMIESMLDAMRMIYIESDYTYTNNEFDFETLCWEDHSTQTEIDYEYY